MLRTLLALAVLAPLAAPAAGPVADHGELCRIHDLATLPHHEAEQLDGQRARFLVQIEASEWQAGGIVRHDCRSIDETHRSLWLPGERPGNGTSMVIEGMLQVIRHPGRFRGSEIVFGGSVEYRVVVPR